ncbi:hypothetical protein CHLRE_16g669300v5 [Chlamydomonas reinhardtii]|uniref:Uncharacterized protein n=1 Tax=Chlamydomonas reinhardtii TaxID=3055 RepID=A0A2K3CUB7_CHLRE|nr:uncharacterized protein CHLRE_16g669300v5 [Chlamydomonas reinhardtii]PNW71877.1 hypothetical protein CHLRE_16g669300v5 [Chlamydomonas reinhardtii]
MSQRQAGAGGPPNQGRTGEGAGPATGPAQQTSAGTGGRAAWAQGEEVQSDGKWPRLCLELTGGAGAGAALRAPGQGLRGATLLGSADRSGGGPPLPLNKVLGRGRQLEMPLLKPASRALDGRQRVRAVAALPDGGGHMRWLQLEGELHRMGARSAEAAEAKVWRVQVSPDSATQLDTALEGRWPGWREMSPVLTTVQQDVFAPADGDAGVGATLVIVFGPFKGLGYQRVDLQAAGLQWLSAAAVGAAASPSSHMRHPSNGCTPVVGRSALELMPLAEGNQTASPTQGPGPGTPGTPGTNGGSGTAETALQPTGQRAGRPRAPPPPAGQGYSRIPCLARKRLAAAAPAGGQAAAQAQGPGTSGLQGGGETAQPQAQLLEGPTRTAARAAVRDLMAAEELTLTAAKCGKLAVCNVLDAMLALLEAREAALQREKPALGLGVGAGAGASGSAAGPGAPADQDLRRLRVGAALKADAELAQRVAADPLVREREEALRQATHQMGIALKDSAAMV